MTVTTPHRPRRRQLSFASVLDEPNFNIYCLTWRRSYLANVFLRGIINHQGHLQERRAMWELLDPNSTRTGI